MKFSVLMSVYDKEKPQYLKKSLNSVFEQSLSPTEVVLVEDGPINKNLLEIIKDFENKYKEKLKVIKLEENLGLGKALNEGLKHCKYEYIARMDTDDICNKDRFKKQMEYLEKNKDVAVLGSNIVEYDMNMDKKLAIRKVPKNYNSIKKYSKTRNPLNHVTVVFKKSIIEKVGNYQDCPYFEDYYLWSRVLQSNYKIVNLDECLVKVRAGQEMVVRRGGMNYIKKIVGFENKLLKLRSINLIQYLENVSVRIIVCIIPVNIRKLIYEKILRKKANIK